MKKVPDFGRLPSVALFCAALLSACASTPETREAEKDSEDRTSISKEVEEEREVGRQMAAKLIGTLGLLEGSEAANLYLNLVGQTVASRGGRPEIDFRFAILKSEEANAYATPGGYVFVTAGLLRQLKSEAELACVLGHEIAHVTERHMYNEIRPRKGTSATETMTRFLSRGASELGVAISKVVNRGLQILLEEGLGKEKEHAADRVGIVYASAAGYDGTALSAVLERLSKGGVSGAIKVHKTHPPFPERLAALRSFMDSQGIASARSKPRRSSVSAVMDKRFKEALRSVESAGTRAKDS